MSTATTTLTIGLALAACVGTAHADSLVFRPDGPSYYWKHQYDQWPIFNPGIALDPTQPVSTQTGNITPVSVYQDPNTGGTSTQPCYMHWRSGAAVEYAVLYERSAFLVEGGYRYSPPNEYAPGSTVDGSSLFAHSITMAWGRGPSFPTNRNWHDFNAFGMPVNHTLPDHFFAGLRITLEGQTHYGWMEVQWRADPRSVYYDVLQWGYESTPNVGAVVAPSPGALAVVLPSVACLLRRRRDAGANH